MKIKFMYENNCLFVIFCGWIESQKLKTQKLKCYVLGPKSQKFPTAENTRYTVVSLVYLISSGNPQNLYRKWCETLVSIVFISLFPYMSIVTLTSDLQNRVHKLISIYVHCDLDLWPLTYKINRAHPLTMANMSAKFDQEAQNGLVAIVFTSLFPYMSIVTLTFDLQNQ